MPGSGSGLGWEVGLVREEQSGDSVERNVSGLHDVTGEVPGRVMYCGFVECHGRTRGRALRSMTVLEGGIFRKDTATLSAWDPLRIAVTLGHRHLRNLRGVGGDWGHIVSCLSSPQASVSPFVVGLPLRQRRVHLQQLLGECGCSSVSDYGGLASGLPLKSLQ